MGKQKNYYIDRETFLNLAEVALRCGCSILRQTDEGIISAKDTSIITEDCRKYYFYLPMAGELDWDKPLGCYNENGNVTIEASYTPPAEDGLLKRGRMYMVNGYAAPDGSFVDRPECLAKLYRKLFVGIKQYTKFISVPADRMSLRLNYYADTTDRYHRLYISRPIIAQMEADPSLKLS